MKAGDNMARERIQPEGIRLDEKKCHTTKELAYYLSCGLNMAADIGEKAGARIKLGKKVLYNVALVNEYMDSISGD